MRASRAVILSALVTVLGALGSACNDAPTLAIAVVHPPGSVIASTTVTVYVSATLTCEAVQFADVDDTTLAGLQVAQETLRPGEAPVGSLADLPRVDHKVIVARGLGDDTKLVTGGCIEADAITDSETLAIDTVPAVLASAAFAGSGDPDGVQVTIANLDGTAASGRTVSWRVIGPYGTKPSDATLATLVTGADSTWDRPTTTCTGPDGQSDLHPVPPDLSGGYAARVRVAWAQSPPPPLTGLTGLTQAMPGSRPLAPTANAAHPCAVGHDATQTPTHVVACLNAGPPDTVDVFTVASSAGVVSYSDVPDPPVSMTTSAGIYALPVGSGSDVDIIAVDSTLGGGALVPVYGSPQVGACPACTRFLDVMYVPACGSAPAQLLGRTGLAELVEMPPLGGAATTLLLPLADRPTALFKLVSAGCITRFDTGTGSTSSTSQQIFVLDFIKGTHVVETAAVACSGANCIAVPLPVAGAGVAFTGGDAPAGVIAEVDATGVLLTTVDIVGAGSGSEQELLDLAQIPSASVPHRIAVGQLDGDGLADYAWDNDTQNAPVLQVAYARAGFDGPLSALTALPDLSGGSGSGSDESVIDVVAGPILGDATDDILVSTTLGAIALPTLVAPVPGDVPADVPPSPTCSGP
jgi:hypothetical protein